MSDRREWRVPPPPDDRDHRVDDHEPHWVETGSVLALAVIGIVLLIAIALAWPSIEGCA